MWKGRPANLGYAPAFPLCCFVPVTRVLHPLMEQNKTPLAISRNYKSYFSQPLKCAVSPGLEKKEKLLSIVNRLSAPGLIIAPDADVVAFVADILESSSVSFGSVSFEDDTDDYAKTIDSFMSGSLKILIADLASSENETKLPCNYVIRWSLPQTIEEYVGDFRFFAESNRPKYSILLYDPADRYYQEESIAKKCAGSLEQRREILRSLDAMERYATTRECRIGVLKRELGLEKSPELCGNCDNCKKSLAGQTIKEIDGDMIHAILACITETREKFGIQVLTDILRGRRSQRIREYKLDRSSAFCSMKNTSPKEIRGVFDRLFESGYCRRTTGPYSSVFLTSLGKKLLGNKDIQPLELPKKMSLRPGESVDMALMESIRNYRRAQAKFHNIPVFKVFNDRVMKEILLHNPTNEKDLKNITGFGEKSWNICGEGLLKVLRRYAAETRN